MNLAHLASSTSGGSDAVGTSVAKSAGAENTPARRSIFRDMVNERGDCEVIWILTVVRGCKKLSESSVFLLNPLHIPISKFSK